MPAGMPYFAWIDANEDTFEPEHLRWDEQIFSFSLGQDEGDPASLSLAVRRPRNISGNPIGLLGPGRKIWCWFALDCGSSLKKFRGRLVGVPTSLFDDLVTLEFVARPIDLVAQKMALAETLKVLPYYDEVVIDPSRRNDPDVVLEGYFANWHYDPETHVLSTSDGLDGEDGTVTFDGSSEGGKVFYDGLGLSLTSGPLSRVDFSAEYTWTQQAQGNVDLTQYLLSNWPNEPAARYGYVTSYTLDVDSWPKTGVSMGDGWVVVDSGAQTPYDLTVRTIKTGATIKTIFPDSSWFGPSTTTTTVSETQSFITAPPGSWRLPEMVTQDEYSISSPLSGGSSSASRNYSGTAAVVPLNNIKPVMVVGYTANRQCTEVVTFSLFADVQHILTDPEDGEALTLDDVRSVNLSETIGEGTDAYIPIGDPARRSYIATARGNQSLEHLIALARAHLLQRSRVVEINFAPKLSRMPEITLRKNVSLTEPRIGTAVGKVIGYSISLDGNDGRINCEVRIGCAIGKGGTVSATDGTPVYCSTDYVGSDYQQFTGRTLLIDSSVGYQPPNADPNDDGIEFLSTLRASDVIDAGLSVENNSQTQFDYLVAHVPAFPTAPIPGMTAEEAQANLQARSEAINNALKEVPTKATFRLKSMSRQFSTDYELQVTDLKIENGYDLEAA